MSKKILSLLMVVVVGIFTTALFAQLSVGSWQNYTATGKPVKVIDTSHKVYYVSGKSFFSYDKETDEVEVYSKDNVLNDIEVRNIYYNYDKEYVVVVYENSNIDILYEDGKVFNIPDIKNVILTMSKGINDVKFYGDRIYLATDFGIVILNDEKHEVSESYNYGTKVNFVGGSNLYWFLATDKGIYYIESDAIKYDFNQWKILETFSENELVYTFLPFNDKYLFYAKNDSELYYYSIDGASLDLLGTLRLGVRNVDRYHDSFILRSTAYVAYCAPELVNNSIQYHVVNYQNGFDGWDHIVASSYEKDESIWALNEQGLFHFKKENGQVVFLKEPFLPNVSNVAVPWNLTLHDNKLYVSNSGPRRGTENEYEKSFISILDGDDWSMIDVGEVPIVNDKHGKSLYSTYDIVFDPNEENTFYIGTWFQGMYKIKDNQLAGHYTQLNTPFTLGWTMSVPQIAFDEEGNLWTIPMNELSACMLPKSKLLISPDELKPSDWYQFKYPEMKSNKYAKFLIAKHSSTKWILKGAWDGTVFVFDDKGTYNTTADDLTKSFRSFTDQDLKTFTPNYYHCIAEDKNGYIWIGTSAGPIVITNPTNAFKDNFRCTRIKIARNDGTDNADYLLQNISISDIFVDGANRKWIGTHESGLYVVSADGTEILEHFTAENSKLPSDVVTEVVVDPVTGIAYVGTTGGLAAYRSDAVQASTDYSDVYAYPNPVRPDYEGWISVTGLMDHSLVKITDMAGNIFFQGYSNGGQITWDGRNRDGKRVKTGVYLVFASSSNGSSGVVTKIMVVN